MPQLFHVENSLRLSRNQPEMIRLREQLRHGKTATQSDYERSVFESMLKSSIETGETAPPPMDRPVDLSAPAGGQSDARREAAAGQAPRRASARDTREAPAPGTKAARTRPAASANAAVDVSRD